MTNNRLDRLFLETDFKSDLFFELSFDLLCIAGYDGYFRRVNPAVSKVLGYTMEELFDRPISEFVYFEDRKNTAIWRNNMLKSVPLLNFENRYLTKSGEIVWLSWTSIPLDDKQLVYAIAKNITHKKKMEEERNLLLTNLTKINSDLKQLTYTTSHDLRSPVNNLLSVFGLLDLSKIEDEETLELIAVLKSTTLGLKNTLNDYVEVLSQKDRLEAQLEAFDLSLCLQNVLKSINSLIQDSETTFEVDFSAAERIIFNKAFMESIFLNLITNSIKYARPGCLPVISIHTRVEDGVVKLVFADNCLGFDMDKVKHKIFGLNQKFHDHDDSKGIGLYLVYNHITSLGGTIEVASELNVGTTFTITFKD